MNKQFYEAERPGRAPGPALSRRRGSAPKATEIGMQALAEAYNTYTEVDRDAATSSGWSTWPGTPPRPGPIARKGTTPG